tara:strand:- start:3911 stop:4153 length:243 start_codon:yes stop_codon:yes gene_type:complete
MRSYKDKNGNRLGRKSAVKAGRGRPSKNTEKYLRTLAKYPLYRFAEMQAEKKDISVAEYLRSLIQRELNRVNSVRKRKVA